MREASERKREHRSGGGVFFTFFMGLPFMDFMVESVFAFDGLKLLL
jgi:hypothetical protein